MSCIELAKKASLKSPSEIADDLNHPNGVYQVIKKFAVSYVELFGHYFAKVCEELKRDADPLTVADMEDFQGSLSGLLRLQEVYNLSITAMIDGNYRGYKGPSLSFEDAALIGRRAFTEGKMSKSRHWLAAALELREKHPDVSRNPRLFPTMAAIKALQGRALVRLQQIDQAKDLYNEARTDDPDFHEVQALGQELDSRPVLYEPPMTEEQANFSRLCQYRDAYHIESPDYKAMKCRYKPGTLPYYVFREEILSSSPFVSVFYDVVTQRERRHLMQRASDKLARGTVINTGHGSQSTNHRTSDVGWLADKDHAATAILSRRIGVATGLSVKMHPRHQHPSSAEDFQIVNYGLAGHYHSHFDPKLVADASGSRIATFLIYLHSVEEGGNTVFTRAGISVAPKPGTSLFWYNFPPSFDKMDDLTFHAGCPVMVGQKWIANKWIRSYGNSVNRPCGLTPDQTQMDLERIWTI